MIFMSCANYYIAAIIITFRSVQTRLWGVHACTLRARKAFASSATQKQDGGSQQSPVERAFSCLSISSHTFTHELPPLHVFFPLPAHRTCHAVCISTPTQPQLSAPSPLHCQRQHPILPPASSTGSFPHKGLEQSLLLVTGCAASHSPTH